MPDQGQRQFREWDFVLLSILRTLWRYRSNSSLEVELGPGSKGDLPRALRGNENQLQRKTHLGIELGTSEFLPEDAYLALVQLPPTTPLSPTRPWHRDKGARFQHAALDPGSEHLGEESGDAVGPDRGISVDHAVQKQHAVPAGGRFGGTVAPVSQDVTLDHELRLARVLALALKVTLGELVREIFAPR